ncbi:MAG: hypothetical protein H0V70_03265 [Ktedonobacteraceae bacterium]|nr:hypothetical protein [Ktedonobacteraceae bacterium]
MLVRLRFHINTPSRDGKEVQPLLAEECRTFAFRGVPAKAQWFDDEQEIEQLLQATSEANTPAEQTQHFLQQVSEASRNISALAWYSWRRNVRSSCTRLIAVCVAAAH